MSIALLSLCIWLYLVCVHSGFWRSSPELAPAAPRSPTDQCSPDVDIIVPARDEAATIREVIASLLAQDYPGRFRVTLVDDNSSDETASLAGTAENLHVLRLNSKPPRWSGKLWALQQGLLVTTAPCVLFTDADIVHDPRHLSTLVAKLRDGHLGLVSEMVRLNCESLAERTLVPAFVYFFQMLYPFARVNDSKAGLAAAAGGTVLVRREVLVRMGGLETIRETLIDDVALATAVKKIEPIYLGHSGLASSIRRYPRFADIWAMIARTAFSQLRFSTALLILTLIGLTVVWWVPAYYAFFGNGASRLAGATACILAAVSYQPTLRRYHCNPTWSLALPLIAGFYMAATLGSAIKHWRGAGAEWKRRSYDGAD